MFHPIRLIVKTAKLHKHSVVIGTKEAVDGDTSTDGRIAFQSIFGEKNPT